MEVDAPSVLLPCAICGRTFMPRSLEKHVKICERAATKKRKPFDSAKQRIQGTDLAEFLPRQEKKRNLYEERRKSSWKETHDDFLQTIRAARGRTSDTDGQVAQRQSSSHASSGVPMRANEKGTCPTCNRRFGVKAYERHVAWCKERSTRLPNHLPTTNNVAKERLEARMKYRAPNLKNRRTSNRDKCSQGSASAPNITGAAGKTSNETTVRNASSRASRRRETASVSGVRRSEKLKEPQRSAVTVTSRGELSTSVPNSTDPLEGTNLTKHSSQLTDRPTSPSSSSSSLRFVGLPAPTTLRLPLCISLNRKKKNEVESLGDDPVQSPMYPSDGDKVLSRRMDDGDTIDEDRRTNGFDRPVESSRVENKSRSSSSARSRKTVHSISARNRVESKVNDVTVNDDSLGMLVRPCNIYKDDQFVTWEKISREKREYRPFTVRIKRDTSISQQGSNPLTRIDDYSLIEEETPPSDLLLSLCSPVEETVGNSSVSWSSTVRELNQTYLIKDSSMDRQDEEKSLDDQKNESSRRSSQTEFHLITEPLSLDRGDSPSTQGDNPNCETTEKSDNEDISPIGTITKEKDFDCHDSRLLRCEALSEDEENSHDDSAEAIESEIDLSKACEFKEDHCEIEEELEEKVEELNDKNQKFSEELSENSMEYHTAFETCEFEEEIVDRENTITEIPSSCRSYTSEIRNDPCEQQEALSDVSENIKTHEASTSKKEKQMWDDNSRFVELPDKNDSICDRDYGDRTETIEKDCESVYETNKNECIDYDKDIVEELPPKEVDVANIETAVEDDQFEAPAKFHDKLDRPLPIPIPIHRLNLIRIDSKIQKNMNLLRGSTDTLISSVEAVDVANGKRSNELHRNSTEEDNLDVFPGQSKYGKARILPVIKAGYSDPMYFSGKSSKNGSKTYWEKASKLSNDRSIDNLLIQDYRQNRLRKRNPKIRILPPVLIDHSPRMQRNSNPPRPPLWSNYVRRHPDFNLVLRCRIGTCKEYDPFLLAERQMHELLSDSSDLSTTVTEVGLSEHARKGSSKRRETLYPLSHSSAFVEYPSRDQSSSACLDKRSAAIAVPNGNGEFEQLVSDLSSDSTETNSISREIFLRGYRDSKERDREKEENSRGRSRSDSSKRELGRRLILDKSIVLGNDLVEGLSNRTGRRFVTEKLATTNSRSVSSRSQPIRAYSAPKSIYERNSKTNDGNRDGENANIEKRDRANAILDNDRKNDYAALSSSDLSLSSIVSSEVDIKRSNSVLDELITSFEDDVLGNDSFPSLRSLLRNESLQSYESCNGPASTRQQHCDRISDEEEFSSPDNYKQQEHKFNADSAYSSLNRKSNYSNHGRSTNDGTNRFEESSSRNNRRENQTSTPMSTGKTRCRMSRFCHECGSRFLETAKFCCQCGVKRLAL